MLRLPWCITRRMVALLAIVAMNAQSQPAEVRFFNWADYLPQEVLERFTRETGIMVRYATYDSNEAMYAKVSLLKGQGYDLVVPSTYYVDRMRRAGLLHALDRSKLPNSRHLDPRHLNQPFDPANVYSLPYLWGSTGIGLNSARIDPATLLSWADLWRPQFRRTLLLPNDMREVFFVGLRTLGYSGNSTDPEQIRQAYEKLRHLMPNVRLFNSDAPHVLYLTGEVDAGLIWSGNAYRVQRAAAHFRYVFPQEGCELWMDNLVIPAGAEHVDNAHRLIDFLLRPDIARLIADKTHYASPNATAVQAMPAELRENPVIYPPADVLSKGEYIGDVGTAMSLYSHYWARLRAGE
ncbi:MAG: extracellular solute-binding protein [Methylococcaceae bacterium]|jgi:spermidine/putrescine transport system substrate-binding protein